MAFLDVIPLDKISPSALSLYLHLLRWQKRARRNPFPASTADLIEATGFSRPTLVKARNELRNPGLGIIQAQEKPGENGVWEFQLLDPVPKGPLPNRKRVAYADLSDTVVVEFFRRMTGRRQSNGAFDCPQCQREGTVTVNLDRGNEEKHGTWRCRKCHSYGGLNYLYSLAKGCDNQMATRGTRAILQHLIGEEEARQHPTATPATELELEEAILP